MKENRYDDPDFFEKYSRMSRSEKGLAGAGEWPVLQAMLPDFTLKQVLDLGCGYGWHCRYAMENGASSVLGIDLSEKMLNQAAGDRQILAKQLNISPHQLSYVTHSGEGEGLLFYGSTILPFVDHFPKNTELYRIMTTKPQEMKEADGR